MKSILNTAAFLAAAAALFSLYACVGGTQEATNAGSGNVLIRFLLGMWHGMIALFALILELISTVAPTLLPWKVRVYQVSAQGVPYDLGFLLGIISNPLVIWARRR